MGSLLKVPFTSVSSSQRIASPLPISELTRSYTDSALDPMGKELELQRTKTTESGNNVVWLLPPDPELLTEARPAAIPISANRPG
ncbi:hypothetical protein R1flu_023638 [Riccia fluitans]|uniref:Uncharacterized protein n=1 Tax=Riccia fluitans TaxID=41844 RepID=A0ABD1XSN4_9MARC